MHNILLTGFEPFGGSAVNASAEAVHCIAHQAIADAHIHTRVLPVDAQRTPAILRALLTELRPDWCIMLGQSDQAAALMIERVAINLRDFRIPDNGGHQPCDDPIAPDGPDAYFTTLPARDLMRAAWAADVPAALSLSAGAYLCNVAFYTALHTCVIHGLPTRCGFIHLPALPSPVLEDRTPRPTMTLDTINSGLRAILQTLVEAKTLPAPLPTVCALAS